MSLEERKKASEGLGTRISLKKYREMTIDWDIEDVNEFLSTKGTRLNTQNLRLKKESDVRYILLHRIWDTLKIEDSGISWGGFDYGSYCRTKKRCERDEKRKLKREQEAE
jgi:hypothetical protein